MTTVTHINTDRGNTDNTNERKKNNEDTLIHKYTEIHIRIPTHPYTYIHIHRYNRCTLYIETYNQPHTLQEHKSDACVTPYDNIEGNSSAYVQIVKQGKHTIEDKL